MLAPFQFANPVFVKLDDGSFVFSLYWQDALRATQQAIAGLDDRVTALEASVALLEAEMLTKLTANGFDFGPSAVATLTVVDGQVTNAT